MTRAVQFVVYLALSANINLDLDNDQILDAEEIDVYGNVGTYPPKGTLFMFK